jgi:hypothetical protein
MVDGIWMGMLCVILCSGKVGICRMGKVRGRIMFREGVMEAKGY